MVLPFLALLFFVSASLQHHQDSSHFLLTPEQAMVRVSTKLKSIKSIRYAYYRDVNYVSEEYRNVLSGSTFLDFQTPQAIPGFRFQTDNETHKMVYDGATLFSIDKKEKRMNVDKQPSMASFSSLSFFYNSIVTLRNSLDSLASDNKIPKTLADTTINGQSCYLIKIILTSKVLRNLGGLSSLTTQRNIIYKLIADKKTNLPLQVIQTNNVTPKDYVLTTFTDYQIDTDPPQESTWHYLTYANEYRPVIR